MTEPNINKVIRDLREAEDLTQAEMAEKLGMSQPAVARMERDGYTPSFQTLKEIARVLGKEIVVTFGEPGEPGEVCTGHIMRVNCGKVGCRYA